jgi:hypothetical protein
MLFKIQGNAKPADSASTSAQHSATDMQRNKMKCNEMKCNDSN